MKKNKREWVNDWLSNILSEDYYVALTETIERSVKYGKLKNASQILVSFRFIKERLKISNSESLIKDYELVIKNLDEERNIKIALKELYSILRQSSYLLNKESSKIHSILYGYLDENHSEEIKNFKQTIEADISKVWVKPLLPNLSSIKGELIKKELLFEGEVTYLENLVDTNQILLGYKNGLIEVRDSQSLKVKNTIYDKNGIEGVLNLKLAKEEYILAISEDHEYYYFSAWDLKSGDLLSVYNGGANLTTSQIILLFDEELAIIKSFVKTDSVVFFDIPEFTFREVKLITEEITKFEILYQGNLLVPLLIIIGEKGSVAFWTFKNRFVDDVDALLLEDILPNSTVLSKKNKTLIVWSNNKIVVLNTNTREIIYNIKLDLDEDNILNVIPTFNIDEYYVVTDNSMFKANFKLSTSRALKGIPSIAELQVKYNQHQESVFIFLGVKMLKLNLNKSNFLDFYYNWDSYNKVSLIDETQILTVDENYIEQWSVEYTRNIQKQNHLETVNSAKLYDLETKLITTSDDRSIRIVDVESTTLNIQTIKGDKYKIQDADLFTRKGKEYVASISGEYLYSNKAELNIWNLENGKNIKTIKLKTTPSLIKIFNNGKIAFTFDDEYCIKIWNLRFGFCIRTIPHTSIDKYLLNPLENLTNDNFKDSLNKGERITITPGMLYPFPEISFSKDGKYAIIGYFDGLLSVFDFNKKRIIYSLKGHKKKILSISILGDFVLTSSIDTQIKLWNISNKKLLKTFTLHNQDVIRVELIELPYLYNHFTKKFIKKDSSKYAISISYREKFVLTDLNLNKEIEVLKLGNQDYVSDFKWIPKSEIIILIINSTEIKLFNIIFKNIITSIDIGRPISKILYVQKEKKIVVIEISGQIHFMKIENYFS